MNKVNWRLTRTPRVRAEESKGTNEPECEQKNSVSSGIQSEPKFARYCSSGVSEQWHIPYLFDTTSCCRSVGRFVVTTRHLLFPQISHVLTLYIPISNSFFIHYTTPPPPSSSPEMPCFVFRVSICLCDGVDFRRFPPFEKAQNHSRQRYHAERTHTNTSSHKKRVSEKERERLVQKVLGFPLPFFCKHSHLCTEKNDLIAPSITKKMFIYTEMIKSNSSVFPSTSSLAHRLSIVPRMSTTLFFAYTQSILAGKIFLSFH